MNDYSLKAHGSETLLSIMAVLPFFCISFYFLGKRLFYQPVIMVNPPPLLLDIESQRPLPLIFSNIKNHSKDNPESRDISISFNRTTNI